MYVSFTAANLLYNHLGFFLNLMKKLKPSSYLQLEYDQLENITVSTEDDFEVVTMYGRTSISNPGALYPLHPPLPYSGTPNVPSYSSNVSEPKINTVNLKSSHPLDGIPFKLSPALEITHSINNDPVLTEVKNTLDRVRSLLDSSDFNYDCSLEKNYLKENSHCGK